MNHIAEKTGDQINTYSSPHTAVKNSIWFYILLFCAMIVHAWVAYAARPFQTHLVIELFFGAVNFAVMITMYYAISRASFAGNFLTLAVASVIAITVGAALTKDITYTSMSAGWAAVLGSAVTCGILARRRIALPKVLGIVSLILMLFASIQLYPMWVKLISSTSMIVEEMTADISDSMSAFGYSAETIGNMTSRIKLFYTAFIRVLPSFTLMTVVFQFALGFAIFVWWLKRKQSPEFSFPNFLYWKMPFATTPLVVVGVLLRLFGSGTMTLIADNLIVMLAIVYSIVGISMLEFFMKRFRFSILSRLIVYILFFLTHIAGLSFLALVGFVDSFFDWRRKYPLPLEYKNV